MFNLVREVSVTGLITRILLINGVVCLATVQTTTEADPSPPSSSRKALLIHHVDSRTSSITISWTSNFSLSSYQVRARSLLSGITLTGQPTNETEYTLTDLMIDTPYDICVTAKVTAEAKVTGSRSDDEGREEACLQLRTIALIRVDSVLVLLGVVSFIVLSVAAALVCWKCSQRNDAAAAASNDATISDYKDDANGVPETDSRKNPDEAARPLLSSADKAGKPKSQPEVEFATEPQSSNNLQGNELSGEQRSDGPTQV